jgi:hypothetical protein
MKPVNLLPADAPVVKQASAGANLGMIGGAAAGLLAVVAVAGYFALARVDSVKSETKSFKAAESEATSETTSVRNQIGSLGQPVLDSDKQLATGAEQVLVSAYTERHDFVQLAQELRGIIQGTGGWYVSVSASSAGGGDSGGQAVNIVAYLPTKELAAGFNERVNGTRSLSGAEVVSLRSELLTDLDSKRNATFWKITIGADLVDTIAPSVSGGGAAAGDGGTGTIVGDGGGDGTLVLSLDSAPQETRKAAPVKKPAAPRNPFDVAATAAAGGGAG